MGRRSINTTKSGKYMNPTDQARKEARKKELKKNKKQRQMVRQAVLKNKDPAQLLEEMEKIDEMEYNVLQPSPLNEKVLKEKRKKLKETFDRVMRLIHEDEPELWSDMKRKEVEYEKRKYKRVQYFESVRHAEQVSIEDIPLPSSTNEKPIPATMPKINLPPPVLLINVPPPATLIKKTEETSSDQSQENKEKEPPGVPPHLPPNICEMRELNSDYESDHVESEEEEQETPNDESKKDKHDKNIEEFMKEVESAQKKKEEEKALEIRIDPTPDVEMVEKTNVVNETQPVPPESIPITQTMPPALSIPRMPYPMFRPPPLRAGFLRIPGPPRPNMGMPRLGAGIRIPGPPMGAPPRKHHERNMPPKQQTTITAKPQIRNLSADVTRFVPTTLRVKRDEPKKMKQKSYIQETQMQQISAQQNMPTKDDAYQQFMNELEDLL